MANSRVKEMKEIFAYRDKFGVCPNTNFTYTPTYLGEDEFGFFHGTQKTLDYRIFQKQKELGETLRNGVPFTSIGYSLGG